MKHCIRLFTFLLLVFFAGAYSPALADWVDVTEQFGIVAGDPVTGDPTTVDVEVMIADSASNPIEGGLRLIFTPEEGSPVPINFEVSGEDGSNPTYYFMIEGTSEGVFDVTDKPVITMEFAPFDAETVTLAYSLTVELNDAYIDVTMFRKKISKTPDFYSGEAKIKVVPIYVTAQDTKGVNYIKSDTTGELVRCGETCDKDGFNCETVECDGATVYARVKPIIVSYIQAEEDVLFNNVPGYDADEDGIEDGWRNAHDVYTAVSLDDGLTWKRRNISRTALKSSFKLKNGVDYPGDSETQDLIVVGPYALVTWVDKYCRSGDPWGMEEQGLIDEYQVTGSQKSVDYVDVHGDEDPRPDLGVRPFSCVWGARGVLDLDEKDAGGEPNPNFGTIVWYKAEQLTSGRRDALRNFNAGIEPVFDPMQNSIVDGTGGFAISWQEDPKGLKTGKGRGPGAGMSGACVNHKTDIWYNFINWESFAAINEDFESNSEGDSDQEGDGDPMSEYFCPVCAYVYDPVIGDPANDIAAGTAFINLPETWECPSCGEDRATFEKDAKPHALHAFNPPVRITDNAVCRQRTATEVYGHIHDPNETDCTYYYEGGTNSQPLLWSELPGDWECPKCGLTKEDSFLPDPVLVKYRNEGAPYCDQFAGNPRVDGDGNVVPPDDVGYDMAYYTTDPTYPDAGYPLDGNTGASRANLSLVNWLGETLALMAYEETKGVGTGSDKELAAMEQAAPYPLVLMEKVNDDDPDMWEAGATNSDCRSCHYQNVVPRDRFIPMATEADCASKGGTWDESRLAYFPYTGYNTSTDEPLSDTELAEAGVSTVNPATGTERCVPCIKFKGGWSMYPRDYADIYEGDEEYFSLPDHMPGWHQAALNCTGCHLPYNTKDVDEDGVSDRADKCPGTIIDDPSTLVTDTTSDRCGCVDAQELLDPDDPDNNKDEPDRFRHGKNVYYHHFAFSVPEDAAISHGDQINDKSLDIVGYNEDGTPIYWTAPGNYDPYENARRVRVVPNVILDEENSDSITLGLLYKQGKDGQGAPADAILKLFKGGFDIGDMDDTILNLSSSTPYLFQDPLDAGSEDGTGDGTGDGTAGDGTGDMLPNRNTPKIDHFYWTDDNLTDSTGYWNELDDGTKIFGEDGYTPDLSANPFENVFSTRLAIYGDTVVAGFAYCVNWSAGKKAKDHYDFFIRSSIDAGGTWTLPVNVSQLKNHEESVSDCRVILPPEDLYVWGLNGMGVPFSQTGAAADEMATGDFHSDTSFFVGVGTKENIAQPNPNVPVLEEDEVFLDLFYSKAELVGGGIEFETYTKENPKYDENALPYLDVDGEGTEDPCAETLDDGFCVPNEPNPAYPELVDEFAWMAKGDAFQGDIQLACNPLGSKLFTIWEQELAIDENEGQSHFQGADVWFRKVFYEEPSAVTDVNQDGTTDWEDGREILRNIGTTAYDEDFLWEGDFLQDNRITGNDFSLWRKEYYKERMSSRRSRWTSK